MIDRASQVWSLRSLASRPFLLTAACLLLGSLVPSPAPAQSGVATVAADASIYEEQPTDNAGADSNYCIGNIATSSTRRAFVRFSLPAIPAGSVITRVVYDFTQVRVRRQCSVCTATLQMRRVTDSWVEGTGDGPGSGPCRRGEAVAGVNWNNQPAVADISASESLPATGQTPTPITIDTDIGNDDDQLIADVQGWVDGTFENFGWRMQVAEEATADNARRMDPGSITIHWTTPQTPSILVEKTGVFDPGSNGETNVGDLINYTITVTNDGEVSLNTIEVSDPLLGAVTCPSGNPIPALAPAAVEVCTGSYAITQDDIDAGQVDNTATASAQCDSGCPVMDEDSHSEPIPPPPLEFANGFED